MAETRYTYRSMVSILSGIKKVMKANYKHWSPEKRKRIWMSLSEILGDAINPDDEGGE